MPPLASTIHALKMTVCVESPMSIETHEPGLMVASFFCGLHEATSRAE
jgi:hypothetical protein